MIITQSANWKMYWGAMPLPAGAKCRGLVSDGSRKGALLLLANGTYVQGNAGGIRTLPQREVLLALTVSETTPK